MSPLRAWTSLFGLATATIVLVTIGCGREPQPPIPQPAPRTEPSSPSPADTRAAAEDEAAPSTLLADWPTGPDSHFAGALILSGQMLGYHEPCGCSIKQKGGLVRRAAIIERLRRQGWNLALADLGSLSADPARDRGGPEQARIKFTHILRAFDRLGYSAVALSADDLRLGATESLMQIDNVLSEEPGDLAFVSANAIPIDGLNLERSIRPSARTTLGPLKLGITAVLDPDAFAALKDDAKDAMLTVRPPADALPDVLADLESDTDVQVLLVTGPPELAHTLAEKFPGFDVVVASSEVSDPPAEPELLNDGKTRLIQVGTKGMYLGILGFETGPDATVRYRRLEINDRYDRDRELVDPIRKILGDELQTAYRASGTLASYPRRPYAAFESPPGATYAGVETCRHCHPNTVAKWESTKHAKAYEPLVNDPRDDGRNRENDASCVVCHTTGFEYEGGFTTLAATPYLKGNQCENCHGPGSKHAGEPTNAAYRQAMSRKSADFDANHRCNQCHDEDNDPHFNFATYWPQIMHSGLDTYTDPKVQQGIAPIRPPE